MSEGSVRHRWAVLPRRLGANPRNRWVCAAGLGFARNKSKLGYKMETLMQSVIGWTLGEWREARKHSRRLMLNPDFQRVNGLSMTDHRDRVLWQLGRLVEEGSVHRAYPKSDGGQ